MVAAPPIALTDTRRVLIVDDDQDLAATFVSLLELEGFNACTACDTVEALLRLEEFEPSIALVDVRLGTESGTELVRRMKAARPDLLTVVVTAYADIDTAIAALQHGAYDFLRKPVRPEMLYAVLARCWDKIDTEHAKREAQRTLARTNRELSDINGRLHRISASTRQLTACNEIPSFARQLLEEFARNMAAEGGSIYIRDGNSLVLAASLGQGAAHERLNLPLSPSSVLARVLATARPVLIRDISSDENFRANGGLYYRDGSCLSFPIRSEKSEDVAGIITLHNKSLPPFTEQDRDLGIILASFSFERLCALQATQALVASDRAYRLLAENITDVIWTTDLDFNFVFVSPSISGLCGYLPEEFARESLIERIARRSRAAAMAAYEQLQHGAADTADAPEFVTAELALLHKDGHEVWTESRASVLYDEAGEPAGYLGVSRDITERRKADEAARVRLQQFMRAERLVSLGTLVAGISHEINNPNQVIMSAVSAMEVMWEEVSALLTQRVGASERVEIGGLPLADACSEVSAMLVLAQDASERLKRIVNDLREFARQESCTETESVNVNDAIERALRLIAGTVKKSTVRLEKEFAADLSNVDGNRHRIEQLFINLIQNACQSLRDVKARVRIETRHDSVNDRVVVCIEDGGCGIAHEHLPLVMDPFFTTRREAGAAGLGLSICNSIVKDYNGTIEINSVPGEGTRVCVSFPAKGLG